MRKTILVTTAAIFSSGALLAGTLSIQPITDLASSGISPANTYTHVVSGGSAQSVNGVNFETLDAGNTPANFNWDTGGFNKNQIACCNNGDWVPATGGVTDPEFINLMGSFTFSGNGDGTPATQTFTLSGLTVGQEYDARVYIRVWDTEGTGRPIDGTFTNGAEVDATGPFPEDRPSLVIGGGNDQQAYLVNYNYIAQTTELQISAQVAGAAPSGSFHMYALSNQIVPEPGTLGLLGLGLLSLGLRRKRGA